MGEFAKPVKIGPKLEKQPGQACITIPGELKDASASAGFMQKGALYG